MGSTLSVPQRLKHPGVLRGWEWGYNHLHKLLALPILYFSFAFPEGFSSQSVTWEV